MSYRPKINLRVNKETPIEIFELGTELTKCGLGFPQYSNDDIVIPGLVSLGYNLEDAMNYAVADLLGIHYPWLWHGNRQFYSTPFP